MKMAVKDIRYVVVLLFLFAGVQLVQSEQFVITSSGTVSDGSEISKAVLEAWAKACAATTPITVLIPVGLYAMDVLELKGPCKAPIELKVHAILKAPVDPRQIPDGKQWITVSYVDHFTLSGTGTLDGQGGAAAWKKNACLTNKNCPRLPYNLSLNFLTNSTITGITSKDSKNFHVNTNGCKNLTFDDFTITAPGDSPNTDGIHIARVKDVKVINSVIGTGDDCISIGDDTVNLHIENVTCGPGHGISVGSLGKSPGEKDIVGILVKNCTFHNTTNGVRIKTWPDSHPGVVTDVHFEDLTMDNAQFPVHIEQDYCPANNCVKDKPSLVKLSKLSFKNIRGTSATQLAVKLRCSAAVPCENVEVADIDLTYSGPEGPAKVEYTNTKPSFSGKLNPPTTATM